MEIHRLRTRWLFAALSVLVLLGVTEALFRLFPAILPARFRQSIETDPRLSSVPHPYIGHLNRPTSVSDPYGFRNNWPWPDAPRIVTLGDSVTLGTGVDVEATWPGVVARTLSEPGVVNLAVGASGPQQYSRVFETFGAGLRARVILIGFFARNDFWDAAMFERWLKSGAGGNYLIWRDTGRPADVRLSFEQPIGKLVRSSLWRGEVVARTLYLGNLLFHAAGRPRAPVPSQTGVEVYEAPDGTRLKLQPASFLGQTRLARSESEAFTRVFAALQRIDSLAHQNGGHALVIFLPSKEEVYLPFLGHSAPDPTAPLRVALEQRGIPYLDLREDFRRAAVRGETLFLATEEPLLGASGHAMVANAVISRLGQLRRTVVSDARKRTGPGRDAHHSISP